MTESFVMYRSFHEALSELTREQYGNVMFAINEYALNGTEIELSGIEKAIFLMAKPQLDANEKRKTNGLKGGRPQKTNGYENEKPLVLENDTEKKPMVIEKEEKQKPNVNDNVNVNANDNANLNVNENECITAVSTDTASQKHKYGQYKHVLLTDEEVFKLTEKEGADRVYKAITFLDEYIEMKGYRAKSHYLAMLKWVFQAVSEQERRQGNRISDEISGMEVY